MKKLPWWIKERHNPQLGTYYVPRGQMTVKAAKMCEVSAYGSNFMQRYETEALYKAALAKLKKDGERVHAAEVGGVI
jgi:hypothetical protein